MKEEIWRPVVGYEGLYEVSNYGNVRSLDRIITYSNGSAHKTKGKVLIPLKGRYLRVCLAEKGDWKCMQIHRLVAQAFPEICGDFFEGCVIDHLDGNPYNNVAENIQACDQKTNINNPITLERKSIAKKKWYEHKKKAGMINPL